MESVAHLQLAIFSAEVRSGLSDGRVVRLADSVTTSRTATCPRLSFILPSTSVVDARSVGRRTQLQWAAVPWRSRVIFTHRLLFPDLRREGRGITKWRAGVCLSVRCVPRPNLRTKKPRKPKIDRMEAHHMSNPWTLNLFRGQGHRVKHCCYLLLLAMLVYVRGSLKEQPRCNNVALPLDSRL